MGQLDPRDIAIRILALAIAIPVHEFAHALSAVNNGDDGPRRDGRLTIFPWDHFDPIGGMFCIMSSIFGVGLGWGRPVMVNPTVLNNPRWSMCKIAAWGPFSNFLLAIAFAIPLRFNWLPPEADGLQKVLLTFLQVNVGLMVFNLIPVGPLDGAKVLVAFLPDDQAYRFSRWMSQYGMMALFALIFVPGLLGAMMGPPMRQIVQLLLGPEWNV